jgi:hypothetical protein
MPAYYGMNQFEFQEEEDLRDYSVWIADLVHCYPPNTPLWMWARDGATIRSFHYNADRLSLPETKGWQWRVIEARPEEVPERERKFRETIIPYMEKWDEIWPKAAKDWLAYLKPFQEFDLERATDAELFKFFRDYLIQVFDEAWMRHFEWMYPAYILFTWFRTVCGELTGVGPHDPLFKKIMAGFDNIMIKFNRELWEFGDRAKELGLDNIFLTTQNDEEVLLKLEGTEAGRKWFEEYRAWLKIRGWRYGVRALGQGKGGGGKRAPG